MKASFVLAGLLTVCCASAQAQTRVYSWVDSAGVHHHADRPPAGQPNMLPRDVDVPLPSPPAASDTPPVASVDGNGQPRVGEPTDDLAAKALAQDKLRAERMQDCEVAQNNLRLLNNPKTKIVDKGATASAKPMADTDRINARVIAERQVQEFCQPFVEN